MSKPLPARETILLVDDEEDVLGYLSKALKEEGYMVLRATDGELALALSENFTGTIHLLITDVMMPVMNGKELALRLCALRPEIKVLFISGYSREEAFPEEVCEDAVDWLPKPFTIEKFNRQVRRLLDTVRKE